MIGLTASFKRLFRGQMFFRDVLAVMVIMIWTVTLGCVCLAGAQLDENPAHAAKIAAAAPHSHIDQTQEPAGSRDRPGPAARGGTSEKPHDCCANGPTLESMKSGEQVRLLMLHLDATPRNTATEVPGSYALTASISHTQAAVNPLSLVQLSISRT